MNRIGLTGRAHFIERALPEIDGDHGVRPVLALELCRTGGQFGCAILPHVGARKIPPEHRVGIVSQIIRAQEIASASPPRPK